MADRQPAAVGGRHLAGDMLGAVGSCGETPAPSPGGRDPVEDRYRPFLAGPDVARCDPARHGRCLERRHDAQGRPRVFCCMADEDAARILGGYALPDTAAMVRAGQSEMPVLTRPGSPRRDSGMSAITLWENPAPRY
jgi:hypothetical protein